MSQHDSESSRSTLFKEPSEYCANEYENKAKQFTQKLIDYYYNADVNQHSKGYIIGQRIYNNLEKAQNKNILGRHYQIREKTASPENP